MSYLDRPWTKHYDAGIPATHEPYPMQTVHGLLEETAKAYPNNPVCVTAPSRLAVVGRPSSAITYAELNDLSDRLAAGLADMGVKKGDRVAIMAPNTTQFVIAFFGILKAGGIVVAINPTYPVAKIADQMADAGIEVAFGLTMFYGTLNAVRNDPGNPLKKIVVSNIKEYFPGLIKTLFGLTKEKKDGHYVEQLGSSEDKWLQDIFSSYTPGQRPDISFSPSEDVALFQYTGGTTGKPKGAKASHQGLVANSIQMSSWLQSADDALASPSFLAAAPFFHVYGLVAVLIFAVKTAAPMYMVPNPRLTLEVIDLVHTFRPTIYMGVPALYNAINQNPDVKAGKYKLDSIEACISGSAPLPPETKRRFEEITGSKLMEGFGMSELAVASHCNPVKGENKAQSIGMPFPDVDCRIVSLDDGETDMPFGEIGELVIKSPSMMLGYHNMPTETTNTLRDGWLYTGDIAYMDDEGYFFIVDRKKDMVLIGGFNVYPNNIEKVIADHPAVLEVGVAGIPHPEKEGQEALKAWIVFKEGQSATEQEILDAIKDHLAPYEVPRRFEFVDDLPKSTVGKILRRELVKMETGG